MNGFAFSAGMVPGMMGRSNRQENSSFSGGDLGLNYRFLSVPEDNENNYSGSQLEEADFSLFPCRKACKEKLGGKGFGFRDCLRECRGKGKRKSVLKTQELELQNKTVDALKQGGSDTSREMEDSGSGSKSFIWIIVSLVILAAIGFAIYFLTRKKEGQ